MATLTPAGDSFAARSAPGDARADNDHISFDVGHGCDSALRRVAPIAGQAAAEAGRLGEIERVPQQRARETDRGEACGCVVVARIPGGDDVVGERPGLAPGSAARRARSAPRSHREEAVEQLGCRGRVEIGQARAGQPRRQSAELIDGDGLAAPARKRKGEGDARGACATQNEPRRLIVGILGPFHATSLCTASADAAAKRAEILSGLCHGQA